MNRTQSQIIYPQDAMPKKLLGTNNFQFKLNQVYSQLVILNQSSILEGSKVPNIPFNQLTLENSKSQGNFNTYQNNYNTSINQTLPLNQNMSQFNLKDSLLNPNSTKSNQSLFQSYEYSVKHFGLLCDRTFIESSKAFKSQKYGTKRNPRGIKLEPLEQQQTHNIDLNKHSKILLKQKSFLPYSQISDWDMRMYIKKSVDYKGRSITFSLNSIEIVAQEQLKSSEEEMQQEQEQEEQINQNSQNKKGSKKILTHMLNFSVLEYLIQYKYEQIKEFFENNMKIVSYRQEDDQDNLIDIPRLEFDFDQFESTAQAESKNAEFQNETYPEALEIISREIEDVTYQVNFPCIEILDQQLNYKKQIYLSREQLRELLQNKFSNLENYLQQYEEDIKELYPEEQEKNGEQEEEKEQEQIEEQEQKQENLPSSKPPSQQQIENQVYFLGPTQAKSVENKRSSTKQSQIHSQNQLEQSRNNQSDLVTNLARLSLTQLEEKKQINFRIKDSNEEKSVFELLGKKYYKELVNQEEYIIISFFPSKISLKQQNIEYAQQITHNLTFQDFYELIALTTHYDMLNYIISKVRFSGERKSSSQANSDEEDNSLKKRASFLKKIDLQLPKHEFDPKNFIILNQENEINGLLKENLGMVTLDNKKYSIKISPPIFEINYSLENRREVQIATIQQLNEILKRGFNFRFEVIP
ncbi:hypothetical protein ABPG74_007042 [Tetrahymena malaccensis]